jgi:hypothetical protein
MIREERVILCIRVETFYQMILIVMEVCSAFQSSLKYIDLHPKKQCKYFKMDDKSK